MKTNKIFWGVFLIVFGILFFIDKQLNINIDLSFIFNFWPIILILIGLKLLIPLKLSSEIFTIIISIVTSLIIYSLLFTKISCTGWEISETDDSGKTASKESISYPYNENINKAELKIDFAFGSFKLKTIEDKLIDGYVKYFIDNYSFDADVVDSAASFSLVKKEGKNSKWYRLPDKFKNELLLGLNKNPKWLMNIKSDFVSSDINLNNFSLNILNLKSSFSNFDINISSEQKEILIDLDCDFSNLDLKIPKDYGLSINIDKTFSSVDLPKGLTSYNGKLVTKNFETATHKIYLNIKANFSSVSIITN